MVIFDILLALVLMAFFFVIIMFAIIGLFFVIGFWEDITQNIDNNDTI